MTTPFSVLGESIKAVPAVRYALGIAGIASVIAIGRSFHLEPRVAILGVTIMLFFMVMLVVFAHLASLATADFRLPALVFTWFTLLLMIAFAALMFSSVFFQWPVSDLGHLVDINTSSATPATQESDATAPPSGGASPVSSKLDRTNTTAPVASGTYPKYDTGTTDSHGAALPKLAKNGVDCPEIPYTDYTKNPPEFRKIRSCD